MPVIVPYVPGGGLPLRSVAVIPARGGSKRIPRKNVRVLDGRPLIAWSIDTIRASAVFDAVVVSTDDDEIADVARSAGALVPFRRPAELSDDHASTGSVIVHAIAQLSGLGLVTSDQDLLCCAYPAAIGVQPDDYRRGRELLEASGAEYVTTVVRYAHPIQRAMSVDDTGRIGLIDPAASELRTQDLPARFHDAGQFYWGRVAAWATGLPIFPNSVALELPASEVLDIDSEDDWLRAERLHSLRRRVEP